LVVDASTLVGELLRERGQALLASPHLDLYVPARMWDETRHEVSRRLGVRVRKGLPQETANRFWSAAVRVEDAQLGHASRPAGEVAGGGRSVVGASPAEVFEGTVDGAVGVAGGPPRA